jgi:hypothetical protein
VAGERRGDIFPTGEQMERMLRLIRPLKAVEAGCRRDIIQALRAIKEFRFDIDAVPPGKTRRQFGDLAERLERLRVSIIRLPDNDAFLSGLERMRRDAEKRAATITVKPSGGTKTAKADAARMRLAAEYAFHLFEYTFWSGTRPGERSPTLTRGGPWIASTRTLFEIATGRKGIGAEPACQDFMHEFRQQNGMPTREEMRDLRRETKEYLRRLPLEPQLDEHGRPKLSWLLEMYARPSMRKKLPLEQRKRVQSLHLKLAGLGFVPAYPTPTRIRRRRRK